jgi:hypothetical protein
MSGEYGYIVRLLRKVEFALTGLGRQREAGRMGQITQRIAGADDVRGALRILARVEGYEEFALRLLYYADTMGPLLEEAPDDRLTHYHVEQLVAALLPGEGKEGTGAKQGPLPDDVREKADRFVAETRTLRADQAPAAEELRSRLDGLARCAESLGAAARRHGIAGIERFAVSAGMFVRFAADRDLLTDIRVVNILDHAGLALESTLASGGGSDDSLAQTTRLLSDPATLLE